MSSTLLSPRLISVSDDIFIVLQGSQNDNVIERPMFMPDVTFLGFSLVFCLYRYKIKLFSHHFLPLIAVVWPSSTPSVLSGINRIYRIERCLNYKYAYKCDSRLYLNVIALKFIQIFLCKSILFAFGNVFSACKLCTF